jgi:hypothetical protein
MSAVLQFDEARHEYTVDGRVVPNVTRIIDWMNDYAHVPADVMQRARELGTAVHLATALYDNDNLDESSVDPAVRPYLEAWIEFRAAQGFTPLLVEHRIHSAVHGYAGTLDRVGLLRGVAQNVLIDIKASAAVMPANGPQTAAYKQGLVESGFVGAGKLSRYTLRLCPELSPPYRLTQHNGPTDLPIFMSALNLYRWRTVHGYKNNDAR